MSRGTQTRKRQAPGARREAILRAASEVFFEEGFKGASIDAVIARVGGSKRAIYSLFGSKEALFAAIVTENAHRALEGLGDKIAGGHDPRTMLEDFGMRLLEVLMSPMTLALFRAVIGEGMRFPELAQAFYDNAPASAARRLGEVLDQYAKIGQIEVEDSFRAAEHFIGMVRGDLFLSVVLGLRSAPEPGEARALVAEVTHIFLDGVTARG
ncbi:MAG: TetR/AcrR family transcriptional regulator C-terminal domain-containing protein [Burkholderiales bacterium]